MSVQIIKVHDPNCPLGVNGLRAYWEARDALSSTPPEARATDHDRDALAAAEFELEEKQRCTCGVKVHTHTAACWDKDGKVICPYPSGLVHREK